MANKKDINELEDNFENEEIEENTLASDSLKPGSKYADPMSKVQMMDTMMNTMGSMPIHDLTKFFHAVMAQFGPNKEYGVGDNSEQNRSTVAMKTNVKEDLDVIFNGHELSEEFKESTAVLFEAALNAKLATETARLEEQYAEVLEEEVANIADELTNKLDSYLNYVVENFMTENEVAIESTLRNELMEEFMVGLKNLFAEHYISVPEERVDVLEAMVDKVSILENRLDETLTENTQLREVLISEAAKKVFVEVASDLALTQQEKFASLAEGIEFDGDLETFEKKLKIIKENYFRNESTSYSSNIEEETFEGDISQNVNIDPQVNRYVQAIARTIKK
jgi:signal transduction histidine kinase